MCLWNVSYFILQIIYCLCTILTSYGANGDTDPITRITQKWHAAENPNFETNILRQHDDDDFKFDPQEGAPKGQRQQALDQAGRFSTIGPSTKRRRKRTTMQHISVEEYCDYLGLDCMRAYQTGKVCARTVYYNFFTFKNYCMMDFTNCKERYIVWQIVHMGDCYFTSGDKEMFIEDSNDSEFMKGIYVYERDFEK